MNLDANAGAFILIASFVSFFGALFLGRFLFWLASFFVDHDTDLPVDSGLRKSDVGRANSAWGDKD